MKILRLQFPHISRIFSASLWLALVALIGVNHSFQPLTYSNKISQIFSHPFSAATHEQFAQTLLNAGSLTRANDEIALVAELSPVLGAATTIKNQQATRDMQYWKQIVSNRPDYRDAYIQLASITYHSGNLTQAHDYLQKAQTLDPNNATVHRLFSFTSKLLE